MQTLVIYIISSPEAPTHKSNLETFIIMISIF